MNYKLETRLRIAGSVIVGIVLAGCLYSLAGKNYERTSEPKTQKATSCPADYKSYGDDRDTFGTPWLDSTGNSRNSTSKNAGIITFK